METSYQEARDALSAWIEAKPIPNATYIPDYLPCSCVYGHVVLGVFLFDHEEFEPHRDGLMRQFGHLWFMLGTEEWKAAKLHACIV